MLRIKPYLSITDKDVSTAAGVHKTTFYHHFANLKIVEDYIEESVLATFEKMLDNVSLDDFLKGRKSFLSLVKSTIQPNEEFYSMVLFLNQNVSFVDRINKTIEAQLKEEFKTSFKRKYNVFFEYIFGFIERASYKSCSYFSAMADAATIFVIPRPFSISIINFFKSKSLLRTKQTYCSSYGQSSLILTYLLKLARFLFSEIIE